MVQVWVLQTYCFMCCSIARLVHTWRHLPCAPTLPIKGYAQPPPSPTCYGNTCLVGYLAMPIPGLWHCLSGAAPPCLHWGCGTPQGVNLATPPCAIALAL